MLLQPNPSDSCLSLSARGSIQAHTCLYLVTAAFAHAHEKSGLDGRRIGVAIEQKHGAVVWMLLKYECVEIYPVHPQAAGQFRQALYPSGSKRDPADGELLLELLVHHRNRLRPLEQDDEPTRRLLMLVEQRRHWVQEKTRYGNRLSARLKVYFPQVLNWFDDIGAAPVLDLRLGGPNWSSCKERNARHWKHFFVSIGA